MYEIFVCPTHGVVPTPGPSGVCTIPQRKVVDSKYVCGEKVEKIKVQKLEGC